LEKGAEIESLQYKEKGERGGELNEGEEITDLEGGNSSDIVSGKLKGIE